MAGLAEGGAGPLPGRRLLKLLPLNVNQVPLHPELHAKQAQRHPPALSAFVTQCLNEANEEDFQNFQKTGEARETVDVAGKKHPLSIEKLKKRDDVEGTWFARRSLHDQVSYEELDGVLRKDHEKNEMEYTPAIYEANTVLEWQVEEQIEGVKDVELRSKPASLRLAQVPTQTSHPNASQHACSCTPQRSRLHRSPCLFCAHLATSRNVGPVD